ncbi:MAG: hypothetical protein NWE80_02505 [Candidatus Bathyarchaeota archaeon]|nr:hypothetical protein [Candidatus Bathyarchaeota archaeon]
MVSATYDHIVATVIVGVIFIGTVVAYPTLHYSNIDSIHQQQLRNTALNVFDSMLLNAGSPSDWGSIPLGQSFNQSAMTHFGLAFPTPFSHFVLDPDKVQKIDPSNPTGGIEYDRVRELLNIEDYGFRLSVLRPFSTNCSLRIKENTVHFYVKVTRTEDGTPIPNAEVRITTTVAETDGVGFDVTTLDPVVYFTNATGICEGSQTVIVSGTIKHAVSLMQITVGGMSTTVVARTEDPFGGLITIYTSGDTITLSLPEKFIGNNTHSERRILEIDAFKIDQLFTLFAEGDGKPPDIKITHGSGYEHWIMEIPGLRIMNPTALIFWLELTLKGYGRVCVLVVGSMNYGVSEEFFSFGPDEEIGTPIVTMRRLVVISDNTYVTQLSFWRE